MAVLSRFLSSLLISVLMCGPLIGGQAAPEPLPQLQVISGGDTPQTAGRNQTQDISIRVVDARNLPVAGVTVTFQLPDQGPNGSFPNGERNLVVLTDSQGRASATGIQWGAIAGTVPIRVTAALGTAHAGLIVRQQLVWPTEPPAPTRTPVAATSPAPARPMPGVLAAPAGQGRPPAPPLTPNVEIVSTKSGAIAKVPDETPAVAISSSSKSGSGKKKWLLLAVAAGAGAGLTVALLSKKSSSIAAASSTTSTIGSPSVNVGPP